MSTDLISRITEKAKGNVFNLNETKIQQVVKIAVQDIRYHPKNNLYFRDLDRGMKDKLMEDMRDNGLINPIIVRKNEDGATYTVLAGHQRLIAARRLGWPHIKAIVLEISEYEAEKLLIRDNLFRRHMGGMELARALDAYAQLSDHQTADLKQQQKNKSVRQMAQELGENRNTIHFYMKLNKLIPELQQLVDEEKLSVTAAQAFTSLTSEEQQKIFEMLGERIYGLKKKEIEEEIQKRYKTKVEKMDDHLQQLNEKYNQLQMEKAKLEETIANEMEERRKEEKAGFMQPSESTISLLTNVRILMATMEEIEQSVRNIETNPMSSMDMQPLIQLNDKFLAVQDKLTTVFYSIHEILNKLNISSSEEITSSKDVSE